jgi:hypothetical protein
MNMVNTKPPLEIFNIPITKPAEATMIIRLSMVRPASHKEENTLKIPSLMPLYDRMLPPIIIATLAYRAAISAS